jgi:hypothetical protein
MANSDTPFGFSQYSGTGSSPTFEQVVGTVAYNASNIFFGDPVEPLADGTLQRGDGTTGAEGIAGIFVGCKYLSVSQKRTVWSNWWPGSDVASGNTVTAYIVNDPNAKFLVQSDSSGLTQTAVGGTIGYNTGTGNTASGLSGAYVTGLGPATATLPFRVVSLVVDPPGAPGTDAASAYNRVIVSFNNVTTRNLTGI